jgi:hypothetical protein
VETLPRWCLAPTQTLVSDVALLGSELDELVACGGVALVGKAPQFLEVALLASKLDELINRVLVTALGSLLQHGSV